jgi:hypothetical protein
MKHHKISFFLGRMLGVLLGCVSLSSAGMDQIWLEVQSSCSKDGQFQYRVGSYYWPIMSSLTIPGFIVDSTNWVEFGSDSGGWTSTNDQVLSWEYGPTAPTQILPYNVIFSAHSEQTNHRLGTGMVTMDLTLYESSEVTTNEVASRNIVGYWIFPALYHVCRNRLTVHHRRSTPIRSIGTLPLSM